MVSVVERKVTRVDHNLRIRLPTKVLEHLRTQQGDRIKFNLEETSKVSVEHLNIEESKGVDQGFLDGIEDLLENYNNTLRNLANR